MSFELFKKVQQVLLNQKDYSEKLRLKGIFDCRTYDTNDNIIDEIHDDNIIVNTSFTIITDLFVDGVSLSKINTLKIGSGGIYNSNVKIALATETDLYTPLETKVTPDVYTSDEVLIDELNKTMTWTWTFAQDEGNGPGVRIYNEAGLFSANGVMFSKKNFTEVVKTPDKKMIVKWSIKMV